MLFRPEFTALVLACAFFAVLFLQSGLDKMLDWKGNLGWLEPHFAKSPLKSVVPLMLQTLTLLEIASGALCALAVVSLLAGGPRWTPVAGLEFSAATLLCLFAGQRIAKDYAGASVLAAYFAVAILGLMLTAGSTLR